MRTRHMFGDIAAVIVAAVTWLIPAWAQSGRLAPAGPGGTARSSGGRPRNTPADGSAKCWHPLPASGGHPGQPHRHRRYSIGQQQQRRLHQ